MPTFAPFLAAFALVLVPAVASAQEGWLGPEDLPSPAAREAPPAPRATPLPTLPARPAPVRTRMRSERMLVSGIILASLGTAALVGGIAKIEVDRSQLTSMCPQPGSFGCALGTAIAGAGDVG